MGVTLDQWIDLIDFLIDESIDNGTSVIAMDQETDKIIGGILNGLDPDIP
jgi:hypothetical protein